MTNLEAITIKLEEERKSRLESILNISGSESIVKNEYGVTIVDDKNVASSLVFKTLNKPKYDEVELVKAIDVVVKELKPDIPTINRNLVPKSLYDEEVVTNEDLRKQVTDLTNEVNNLSNQITDLNNQVQSEINQRLNIEQTNDVVANQLEAITSTVADTSTQIATSLQKSVDESILRAALQSQNAGFKAQINALIKQIDSLNAIIKGLQSQLGAVQQQQSIQQGTQSQAIAAGGDVISEVVVATFEGPKNTPSFKLHGKLNAKTGDTKFESGGDIKFINNDTQAVTIEISVAKPAGLSKNWVSLPKSTFTLEPGKDETIKVGVNKSAGDGRDSKRGWAGIGWTKSENYDSTITLNVIRSTGSKDSKTYPIRFTKNHPDSY
jgi:predicted  nucleic acid-binding Zn-ribbon protein